MNRLPTLYFAAAGLGLLAGCRGDLPQQRPLPPAPDPCALPPAAKYFIRVASKSLSGNHFFSYDTTYPGNVRFSASALYTSVAWRIGQDPRTFTNNPQLLDFQQSVGTVTVRFIGTRPVDKCRPGDRGVDTLFTTLTVVPFNSLPYRPHGPKAAIEGVFLGATTTAPQDTFRVRIGPGLIQPGDSTSLTLLPYNLNKGCPGLDIEGFPQYRAVEFTQPRNDAQCHGVYGYAVLDSLDRNKLRILYHELLTPNSQYTDRVFIGIRQK